MPKSSSTLIAAVAGDAGGQPFVALNHTKALFNFRHTYESMLEQRIKWLGKPVWRNLLDEIGL